MWIRASIQLSDNVAQLTTAVSSHFLIFGDNAAIIDSGIIATADQLADEVSRYLADGTKLSYIFLTHVAADTLGGVYELRKRYPDLALIGSPLSAEQLSNEENIRSFYNRNQSYGESLGAPVELSFEDFRDSLKFNRILGEGDTVSLGGGVNVKVIASPGYRDDSTGYYVKEDGALAAGESVGGYNGRDRYCPCFNSSFEDYVASIDKFLTLDVRVLSLPHAGALTGELAKRYLMEARVEAERFAKKIQEKLAEGMIKEEISFDILNEWTTMRVSPNGPFADAQREALSRMIDVVSEGVIN
jgi:hydroxyacylglutathione hydrolase